MTSWDPIGVAGIQEAEDEYDGYVVPILELLARRASDKELAEYLLRVETQRMGLTDAQGVPLVAAEKRGASIKALQAIPSHE